MKNEKLITDLSRDFEKIYIDLCHSYDLKINLGCRSYYDVFKNTQIAVLYRIKCYKPLYLHIIRYLKFVSPIKYRNNKAHIMSYYAKKDFPLGYEFVLSLLPINMLQFWQYCMRKVNY